MHTHILFLSFLINKLIGNATIYQTARIAIYAAITNPNTAPTITPSITKRPLFRIDPFSLGL